MKKIAVLLLLVSSIGVFAQNSNKNIDLSQGTVAEKFDLVYQKSGKYQNYKVVDRMWLVRLKKQVIDSINLNKKTIVSQNDEISKLQSKVTSLNQSLIDVKDQLNNISEEKESIKLFGMQLKKSDYKMIMWALIGLLLFLLIFFIYKFNNSNKITLQSKENYNLLEEEYNSFRSNALEREQLLKRQLLDEQKK